MDMKPSRFTDEQIIGISREQEAGSKTGDVCPKYGISSATFYKWKARYGGLDVSDARRLKDLTKEEMMHPNFAVKYASVVGVRSSQPRPTVVLVYEPSLGQDTPAMMQACILLTRSHSVPATRR
jgi:putative transposase